MLTDADREYLRRKRVVQGWEFKNLTWDERDAIERYLDGGECPEGYEKLDELIS